MSTILWICVAVAVGLYIVGPIQDPDLWWHIASGRWILAHGTVPHEDPWGMFSHGQPWRAYSWCNEILFALADRWFGVEGLLTLKLVLATALVLSLGAVFSKISGDWYYGLLLGIFATTACYNHFTLRPQSLIWILFAWLLLVADRIERQGINVPRRAALVLLMAAWANTHLTAIIGVGAVALWALGEGETHFGARWRRAIESALWCILGTLLTPYLGGEWLTFVTKVSHPSEFSSIAEFQPATVMQYSTAFLVLGSIVLGFLVSASSNRRVIPKLVLWTGFTLGSLAVLKFLPFAVILTCALIARVLSELRAQSLTEGPVRNFIEGLEQLRRIVSALPREGLSFVFLCLAIVSVYRVWQDPLALSVVPKRAVDFIEEHKLPMPIANIFGHGGYLIYRLSDEQGNPRQKVAIDGRTNLISKELWSAYSAAARGKRNWRDYLNMVQPETILWREDSPLISILLADKQWCLVHESGADVAKVSVFVKREYFDSRRGDLQSVNCA